MNLEIGYLLKRITCTAWFKRKDEHIFNDNFKMIKMQYREKLIELKNDRTS